MKIPFIILVLSLAFTPGAPFLPPRAEFIEAPKGVDPVVYEGKIDGWSVAADGTVAIRLVGTRQNKAFSLWFATPGSQNATTRYENLVLEAVVAFVGPLDGVLVRVTSSSSNDDSGKSIEDAMTLSAIGHH